MKFDPFESKDILLDDSNDPDKKRSGLSFSNRLFFVEVLCLTESWFNNKNSEYSLYELPQYTTHQRGVPSHKSGRGEWREWHKHEHT